MNTCLIWRGFVKSLILLLIGFLFLGVVSIKGYAHHKILVLHSYHKGMDWTDDIMISVESMLTSDSIDLYVEYMDTKRHPPNRAFPLLRDLYSDRYQNIKFDLIISSDDNALDFLLTFRDSLFSKVPVVFCGVNQCDKTRLQNQGSYTGVIEVVDLKGTIDLALQLHPKTKHIIIIERTTHSGQINLEKLRKLYPQYQPQINFIELIDISFSELNEKLTTLPPQSLIINTSYYQMEGNKSFSYQEYMDLITTLDNVPVYTAWDFQVEMGAVGGRVVSGVEQGMKAAEMALQILNGKNVDQIPIQRESPNVYMFDCTQLERFGISISDLPSDSIILKEPQEFYSQYKHIIWAVIVFILLLGITIVILSINIIRRRRVEVELMRSEQQYRSTMDALTDLVHVIDRDFKVVLYNSTTRNYLKQVGLDPEITDKPLFEAIPILNPNIFKDYEKIFENGDLQTTEEKTVVGDQEFYTEGRKIPIIENGVVKKVVTVIRDVTERKLAEKQLLLIGQAVESSSDAIGISDTNKKVVYLNEAAKKLFGYTIDELNEAGAPEVLIADKKLIAHIIELAVKGEAWSGEAEIENRNGERIPTLLRSDPVRDKTGQIIGFVGTHTNITELKQTQKALEENRENLAVTLDSIGDAVIVTDQDRCITRMNPIAEKLTGWRSEDAIGKHLHDIFAIKNTYTGEKQEDPVARVLLEGKIVGLANHTTLVSKDGHEYQIADSAAPIKKDGYVIGVVMVFRDVTEEYAIRQSLKESQERLTLALEATNDGLWDINLRLKETYYSPRYYTMLGYEPGEFAGTFDNWKQMIHPDDANFAIKQAVDLIKGRIKVYNREVRMKTKLGEWKWILIRGKVVEWDRSGSPIRVIGTNVDITERKHGQELLKESELRYRSLFEEAPDAIFLADMETGILIDANPKASVLLKKPKEEIIGRHQSELHPPDRIKHSREHFMEHIRAAKSNVILHPSESFIIRADGTRVPVEIRAQMIQLQGKKVLQGVFRDITERKEAEQKIEQQRTFLRTMIDTLPDLVFCKYLNGVYFECNPAFTKFIGRSRDQIIGYNDYDFFSKDVADFFRDHDMKMLATKRARRNEEWAEYPDGRRLFLDTIKMPYYNTEGEIIGLIGISRDITDRYQMEVDLQKSKEAAEAANKAKSVFLANMSHELRTPLNGILGYTQILKRDNTLNEKQKHAINIVHQSGEHLLMLINDILDLSKIEAGKLDIHTTEFHLAGALKSIIEMTRIRAAQVGLSFEYIELSPLPKAVYGDEKRLRQVLLNLLGNAVKFTEKGDVTFKIGVHYGKIRFQVEDTGIGIPPEEIEKIFQPFQQINDQSLIREGTGLGLAISQQLVERMGGELNVSSTPGEGSMFWFDLTLPETGETIESIDESHPEIIGFKGDKNRILVVDDKNENRSVIYDMLLPLGFKVADAVDGQDAIQKALEFQPHLILMDLIMPVMGGLEATRQIRQISTLKNVVIIAVSASAFEYTRQESLQVGCDDFIPKPIRFDILLERLSSFLNLEWIYKDRHPVLSLEREFILPPKEELRLLSNLADIGDIREIHNWLNRIESTDKKYEIFILKFRQLTQNFSLTKIRELVKSYLENY